MSRRRTRTRTYVRALWRGRMPYPKRRHLRPVDMSREERKATAQLARAERLTLIHAAAQVTGVPERWLREMTTGRGLAPSPMLRVADAVLWYRVDVHAAAAVHPFVLQAVYTYEEPFATIPVCRRCYRTVADGHQDDCELVPVEAAAQRAAASIDRLWAIVDRYAMHDPECPINIYGGCEGHVCDCGLDEACRAVEIEPTEPNPYELPPFTGDDPEVD